MRSSTSLHLLGRLILPVCFILTQAGWVNAQKKEPAQQSLFTIENYYRVKWGFADEFILLWKKNHYPLLKKVQEAGDIISVTAVKPQLHGGEDTRWDFKVTIVFRNPALAFDPLLTAKYKPLLYPDAAQLAKDERYRFELLTAHWDIPVEHINPDL